MGRRGRSARTETFANLASTLAEGSKSPFSPDELEQRVRTAVLDSVKAHLLADVEVGLFLSAGVDSGALLRSHARRGSA